MLPLRPAWEAARRRQSVIGACRRRLCLQGRPLAGPTPVAPATPDRWAQRQPATHGTAQACGLTMHPAHTRADRASATVPDFKRVSGHDESGCRLSAGSMRSVPVCRRGAALSRLHWRALGVALRQRGEKGGGNRRHMPGSRRPGAPLQAWIEVQGPAAARGLGKTPLQAARQHIARGPAPTGNGVGTGWVEPTEVPTAAGSGGWGDNRRPHGCGEG